MKKLVLLCMLVSIGFAEHFGCKSERDLYLLAESSNVVKVARDLMRKGKCEILYDGKVIYDDGTFIKIRYGSELFWALSPKLK